MWLPQCANVLGRLFHHPNDFMPALRRYGLT
jgi:hypothetical protein